MSVSERDCPSGAHLPSTTCVSSSKRGSFISESLAPARASQSVAVPSYEAESATCGSVGCDSSTYTSPPATPRPRPALRLRSQSPDLPHHTCIAASEVDVSTSVSSHDHATAPMTGTAAPSTGSEPSSCELHRSVGKVASAARVRPARGTAFLKRQSRAEPSFEPETSASPAWLHATEVTSCLWPRSVQTSTGDVSPARGVGVCCSGRAPRNRYTTQSVVPTAKRVPPGLHAPQKASKLADSLIGIAVTPRSQPWALAPSTPAPCPTLCVCAAGACM
mmetsp:Transcript_33156/g.69759  ORF Transcript_33156/g.69759 Transcript_33156/m.69759 type:complete len:277 (+) Transcript_33156:2527-3357(+)